MRAVGLVAAVIIAVAAVLALIRVARGPTTLDRAVGFDVLTSCLVGAIAVEAAISRRLVTIPILVALALVGFLGSVTIARFSASREGDGGLE